MRWVWLVAHDRYEKSIARKFKKSLGWENIKMHLKNRVEACRQDSCDTRQRLDNKL
jgi:hypothetical protein